MGCLDILQLMMNNALRCSDHNVMCLSVVTVSLDTTHLLGIFTPYTILYFMIYCSIRIGSPTWYLSY